MPVWEAAPTAPRLLSEPTAHGIREDDDCEKGLGRIKAHLSSKG
ncbi:hypothetical protein ACFUJR_16090 [Streptomyces sp. NPDC057271]